ncbi:MAG: SdiA-regulated domain-containing protein [Candidatus Marinimicrobia bacterium]|nr:SdiA-regulated domain-containing protein [Candidatus Neomarinimicrobiota bacterium]
MKLVWIILVGFMYSSCSLDESPPLDDFESKLIFIESVSLDVPEPSGLTLNGDGSALYVVSDPPDNSVYKIDLLGNIKRTLYYSGYDLEGVTYDLRDHTLWIAEESLLEIVHIDTLGNLLSRHSILFDNSESNKGFEGIVLNPTTGTINLLNEKNPGVFLVLDSALIKTQELELGFAQDYSGICLNDINGNYFIVSDESKQMFEWNEQDGVINTYSLNFEKAEGVGFNSNTNRIYIVSDSEQKLYIYEFQ